MSDGRRDASSSPASASGFAPAPAALGDERGVGLGVAQGAPWPCTPSAVAASASKTSCGKAERPPAQELGPEALPSLLAAEAAHQLAALGLAGDGLVQHLHEREEVAVGEGENAGDLTLVQPESFKGGADSAGLKRAPPRPLRPDPPLPPLHPEQSLRTGWRACGPGSGPARARPKKDRQERRRKRRRNVPPLAPPERRGAGAGARGCRLRPRRQAQHLQSVGSLGSWDSPISLAWEHDGGRFRSGGGRGGGGDAQEALRHPEELGGMGDGALHIHRLCGGPRRARRAAPGRGRSSPSRAGLGAGPRGRGGAAPPPPAGGPL